MTWSEFLAHAEGANRGGFYSSFGREDLDRLDPPTDGDRWLAENDKRREPRQSRDDGYYGPTEGFWYVGFSDGVTAVLMMGQRAIKRKPGAGRPPKWRKNGKTAPVEARHVTSRDYSKSVAAMNQAKKYRDTAHASARNCVCVGCMKARFH